MSDNKLIPDCMDKSLEQMLAPVNKSIGESLSDIWYLVAGGRISLAKNKKELQYSQEFKKFKEEFLKEADSVPEERRVAPDFRIAAQILEDSIYCLNIDELREMFVKLLGKTVDKEAQDLLHPSYPDIIKQMSSLDAKLLMVLKRNPRIPIVNYISKRKGNTGFRMIQRDVVLSEEIQADEFHIAMSISALRRWGIISVNNGEWFTDDSQYGIFRQSEFFSSITKEHAQYNESVEIQKGICELTSFGHAFTHCCVP